MVTERLDRPARRAARRLRKFVRRHGTSRYLVEPVGQGRVRLVVVGADGAFGDLVVDGLERAMSAAGSVARAERAVGELGSSLRTGSYEWRRMAGIQLGRS